MMFYTLNAGICWAVDVYFQTYSFTTECYLLHFLAVICIIG